MVKNLSAAPRIPPWVWPLPLQLKTLGFSTSTVSDQFISFFFGSILILIFLYSSKSSKSRFGVLAGYLYYLKSRLSTRWHTFAVSMRQKRSKRFTNLFVFLFFKRKKKVQALRLEGFCWDGARQLSLKEQAVSKPLI